MDTFHCRMNIYSSCLLLVAGVLLFSAFNPEIMLNFSQQHMQVALFSVSPNWIGRKYKPNTPVYLGSEWTADCRLSDPNITVELREKDGFVNLNHPYLKKHYVKQKGQKITLYNLPVRLSGDYCCHAKGEVEIKTNCLTFLDVQPYKKNYNMSVKIDNQNKIILDYFDNLEVRCESPYDGSLFWFNSTSMAKIKTDKGSTGVSQLIGHNHFEDIIGRRILNRFARLIIRKATEQTTGKYFCKKTDKLSNTKSDEIEINVSGPKPASIQRISPDKVINTGDDVELYCRTQGSPKPNITWSNSEVKRLGWCTGGQESRCYKENKLKTHYNINATTLSIKNVSYTLDHGRYTCDTRNMFGQENKTLFLTVQVKPKIMRNQESQICDTKLDGSCELTCEVKPSVPQPNITWFYQPYTCINTTCSSNASAWQVPPNYVGRFNFTPTRLEKDSYRSVFILSPHIRRGFFQCYAVNVLGDDNLIFSIKRPANVPGDDNLIFSIKRPANVPGDDNLIFSINRSRPALQTSVNPRPFHSDPFAEAQWYIFSGIVTILVVAIFIACLKLYQNKKRYGKFHIIADPITKLDPKTPIIDQSDKLWYDYQWEFPSKGIHLEHKLGSGKFGEVYLAEASGVIVPNSKGRLRLKYIRNSISFNKNGEKYCMTSKVAVKKLKDDATHAEYKELLSELKILIHIDCHENVVNLLGACTKVTKQRGVDLVIILEYCSYGCVLNVLRSRRERFRLVQAPKTSNIESELTLLDLVKWANQVAKGMEFLASRECIHRDLAARNVLIGSKFTAKVADFGLARDIYKTMRYTNATSMVPLKWTAIEALQDGISNFKSDVWSFGIFLWELFTLGGEPYPHLSTAIEVLDYLNSGERLAKPTYCPFEIYTMMTECWQQEPNKRPSFTELEKKIRDFHDNIKLTEENSQKFENEEVPKPPPKANGRINKTEAHEGHSYLNIDCMDHNETRYQDRKLNRLQVTFNPATAEY